MNGVLWRSVLVVGLVASRYAAGFALPSRLPTNNGLTQNAAVPLLPHERFVGVGHHRAARQVFCGNFVCDLGETALSCPNDCRISTCGVNGCEPAQGETSVTCPTDCGSNGGSSFCNFNTICEPALQETIATCPSDCTTAAAVCGDGVCQATENAAFCPTDCKCGNNICEPALGETMATCNLDCKCGDGVCDTGLGETVSSCPSDCFCGNFVCDVARNENSMTCPQDCPATTSTTNLFPTTTTFDPFAPATTTFDPFAPTTTAPINGGFATSGAPLTTQCNGDGYCDAAAGESLTSCPLDCGGGTGTGTGTTSGGSTSPLQSCNNNGVCDAGESLESCFNDCLVNAGEGNKLDDVKSYVEANPGAVLKKGDKLKAGKRLNASCDVYLELTMDGNIVIESVSEGRIWESQSDGQCTRKCSLVLDTDGVLKLLLKISPGEYREQWSLSNKPSSAAVLLLNGNFLTVDEEDTITYQTGESIAVENDICSNKTTDGATPDSNNDGSSSTSSSSGSDSASTSASTDALIPTITDTSAFSFTDSAAPTTTSDPFATSTSSDSSFPFPTDSSSSTFPGFTDAPAAVIPSDTGFPTITDPALAAASSSSFFDATPTPTPSTPSSDAGYCGDGVCVPPERFENCPNDCPAASGDVCGDGFCGVTENAGNCAGDCQAVCGDGYCGATENSTNCPVDCYCGNGQCAPEEQGGVCVQDCPV